MKHHIPIFGIVLATAFFAATPFASARDSVSLSVNLGGGMPAPVYAPPPAVVVAPQPVYVQPAPVYARPAPVIVQPAAVVEYGRPYVVEEGYYRHGRHWRHHHHD